MQTYYCDNRGVVDWMQGAEIRADAKTLDYIMQLLNHDVQFVWRAGESAEMAFADTLSRISDQFAGDTDSDVRRRFLDRAAKAVDRLIAAKIDRPPSSCSTCRRRKALAALRSHHYETPTVRRTLRVTDQETESLRTPPSIEQLYSEGVACLRMCSTPSTLVMSATAQAECETPLA